MSIIAARVRSYPLAVILTLMIAACSALFATSPAFAASAGTVRFSNQSAYAAQEFTSDCRYGYTSTGTGTVDGAPRVDYFEYVYNWCNGWYETYRSGSATPASYSFNNSLKLGTPAVHVTGWVPLSDINTGESAGSIYLDMTWTPTSTVTRTKSTTTQTLPDGSLVRTSTRGLFSLAKFTGPFPATYANIGSEKGSTLEISFPRS